MSKQYILSYHSFNIVNVTVSTKTSKKLTKVGMEMLERYRRNESSPVLVDYESGDDEFTRRIKRIINHMSQFVNVDRKNIQEVEEEYEGEQFVLQSNY